MNPFLSTLVKELKILIRDRAGLAVLFAMPICLVLIVTMVQDNVMKITGATVAQAIFVDQDGGEAARLLKELLDEQDSIETTHENADCSQELQDIEHARLTGFWCCCRHFPSTFARLRLVPRPFVLIR